MTVETGRCYQIYGQQIRSLTSLRAPECQQSGGEDDASPIQIDIISERSSRVSCGAFGGRSGVRVYPRRYVAVYSDSQERAMYFARNRIVVKAKDFSDAGQQFYLLKCLMPMVSSLTGHCLLHASAFAIDGEAFVIIGGSGYGKSTLATLAEQYGAEHLADDVVAVHREGDRCFVSPSGVGRLLLSSVVDDLDKRGYWSPDTPHYQLGQKLWYPEFNIRKKRRYPVRCLIFLKRSEEVGPEAIDDALKGLITGTLGPLDFGRYLAASHLPLFSDLLRSVPYSFVTAAETIEGMNMLVASLISSPPSAALCSVAADRALRGGVHVPD